MMRSGVDRVKVIGPAIGAAMIATAFALLGGCATPPAPQKETKMVWPPPPQQARIQFVRNITSEKDLNSDTTFSEGLSAFLTGEKMPSGRIAEPVGLAVSDDGDRLYIADMMQAAVFKYDFKNKKFTKFGAVGVPSGIALDAQENVYVVDTARKGVGVFAPDGKELKEISDPELVRPNGLAIDKERGRMYVVDTGQRGAEQNVKIYDLEGKRLGAIGGAPGGDFGQFSYPTYVAVDSAGNVYVTDTLNSRVQKFGPDGKFLCRSASLERTGASSTSPRAWRSIRSATSTSPIPGGATSRSSTRRGRSCCSSAVAARSPAC
jgi:hypothetical protein